MTDETEILSTLTLVLRKLDRIEEAQRRQGEDTDRIREAMANIEGMVQKVIEEVKPTIDSLMNNPMLRMALGIKG